MEEPAKDASLTGEKVDLSGLSLPVKKVFVLNEGSMGAGNATLDFLRISDENYITGSYKMMNPSAWGEIGDVGNDILIVGDEVWMAINNSGLIEVLSAVDETELATLAVPTPRNLATDGKYIYVSSWAGAYVSGSYDADGNYTVTSSKNPEGQVYRIDPATRKVLGSVTVGYQPEGLACSGGKLYVANSGGISSQLPPTYAYDNTVSVIDTESFQVVRTLEVQVNLKNVYADSKGNLYVTTLGNYWDVHSGLYRIDPAGKVSHIADYVTVSTLYEDTLYCIGAEEEFDWYGAKTWKGWSCRDGQKGAFDIQVDAAVPYGLFVVGDAVFLADAGDYFNPGTVSLYRQGRKAWSVNAGVCPGHFAAW